MPTNTPLSVQDRFEIFEQLNRHQRYIDNDAGLDSVHKYQSLYWPEGKFILHDVRHTTFEGPAGIKQLYDYAHSVFPLDQWKHSMGHFVIDGAGDDATVEWQWVVSWRAGVQGTVSTGTYTDRFQKRGGQWKCLERTSGVDPNWPTPLFQPYVDQEKTRFKAS